MVTIVKPKDTEPKNLQTLTYKTLKHKPFPMSTIEEIVTKIPNAF